MYILILRLHCTLTVVVTANRIFHSWLTWLWIVSLSFSILFLKSWKWLVASVQHCIRYQHGKNCRIVANTRKWVPRFQSPAWRRSERSRPNLCQTKPPWIHNNPNSSRKKRKRTGTGRNRIRNRHQRFWACLDTIANQEVGSARGLHSLDTRGHLLKDCSIQTNRRLPWLIVENRRIGKGAINKSL